MPIELLLFLAIPIVIILISRYKFPRRISYKEMGIQFSIISILVIIVYTTGIASMSHDVEIFNGVVTSKDRLHDEYEDPYDCMCMTSKDGITSCQTCYETRYTVDWFANSSVGRINFKSLDTSSKSVYLTPDPILYKKCIIGEPASIEHPYENYILAVPDSLFNNKIIDPEFASKIPNYPRVFNLYHINRVLNVDSDISSKEVYDLNKYISNYLRILGGNKEVNVIVILTEIDDPNYRFSVEASWLGGNKNDVIVIIGLDGHTITWSDTITWALNSGNEHFQVNMRDNIMLTGEFDVATISNVTQRTILEYYDRPTMKSFEHIKDDIEPPTYMMIIMFIVSVFGSVGLSYYFYRNEM